MTFTKGQIEEMREIGATERRDEINLIPLVIAFTFVLWIAIELAAQVCVRVFG